MSLTLHVQPRTDAGLSHLRDEGLLPVVFYGSGIESTSGTVIHKEFVKVYRQGGQSTLITLETALGTKQALVHEMQLDPVTNKVLHVDFIITDTTKPIEVTVPLVFVGEAPAEKQGLGVLVKALHDIEIEVLPNDIPHEIEVDLSSLVTLDDNIYASDLVLPATASLRVSDNALVATVNPQKEEADEPTTGAIDFDAIAVEKKGKKEVAE